MADGAVIPFPTFEFEGNDLLILELGEHFGLDAGARDEWGAESDLVTINDQQYIAEGGFSAGFDSELLDIQDVSLGDTVLLAAGLDDCVGHGKSLEKGE